MSHAHTWLLVHEIVEVELPPRHVISDDEHDVTVRGHRIYKCGDCGDIRTKRFLGEPFGHHPQPEIGSQL